MLKKGAGMRRASSEEGINERAFCASVALLNLLPILLNNSAGAKRGRIVDQRMYLHVSGAVGEGGREMEENLRITVSLAW